MEFNRYDVAEAVVSKWLYDDDMNITRYIVPDIQINLIHYMVMNNDIYIQKITKDQLKYITQNPTELYELLGNKYTGPADQSSLLFAILSGKSARYQIFKIIHKDIIMLKNIHGRILIY